MHFTARIYFDLTTQGVFLFYGLLARAEEAGAVIDIEWRAFGTSGDSIDRTALAATELVRVVAPDKHGRFVQALLAVSHIEGADMGDPASLNVAARVADVSLGVLSAERLAGEGAALLAATETEARALSVRGVPTLYRQGPVMMVRLVGKADDVEALKRLRIINDVLNDDVLWELGKP